MVSNHRLGAQNAASCRLDDSRIFVEAGIAPAQPRSKRGGLLLADSTLSKNENLGLARYRAWFPGLRNRCSSSKASGPSQELAGVGYRARFPGLKDRCSSSKASPAKSAAAPIRTEFSRSSNGRYSKPAPTAYWGDQPDSNRLREDHSLLCCPYNMAAMRQIVRPGRIRTSINSLIRRVCLTGL